MSADREIPAGWLLVTAVALGSLALGFIATAGCASKRSSVPSIIEPNQINGPPRPLPVIR